MCEQCANIDETMKRYGVLASSCIADQTLIDGVMELVDLLRALKVAVHPNQVAPIGQPAFSLAQ